ncbi:MAG: DUF4193 family protein [Actinobacteria bacterium]|nr:DUF4193 family protein [Actinomycetota bacterium]
MAKDQEQLESFEDDEDTEDDDEVDLDAEVIDDDLEVDDDLAVDDEVDEIEEAEAETPEEDEDEDTEASLDQILDQRAKAELGAVNDDDDDDDLLELVIEEVAGVTPLRAKITPVKEKQEFVCARCHLVKNRSQMADPKRVLCRDCV